MRPPPLVSVPGLDDLRNPRRAPRVRARLAVEVRRWLGAFAAESEDLSEGGCALVTPRLVAPGRRVRLTLAAPALGLRVRCAGRVAWIRERAPYRLGVAFAAPVPALVARLCAADPACAAAAGRHRDRLPRRVALHLGEPPRLVVDFTADELAVLRRIGDGATAGAVIAAAGADAERTVGAIFALLARGTLVQAPVPGGGPRAWRAILAGAPAERGRPPEAQRLFAEGVAHLGAGRLVLAIARLEAARALAPDDPEIAVQLARIRRLA